MWDWYWLPKQTWMFGDGVRQISFFSACFGFVKKKITVVNIAYLV